MKFNGDAIFPVVLKDYFMVCKIYTDHVNNLMTSLTIIICQVA